MNFDKEKNHPEKKQQNEVNYLEMDDETFTKTLNELSKESKRNIRLLILFFLIGFAIMYYIYSSFPKLDLGDKNKLIRFPRTPQEIQEVIEVINKYTDKYYYHVLVFFISVYIFFQSFGIPGPLILSIMSGALFGRPYGFSLVCVVASLGASSCYFISSSFAKYFIFKLCSKRVLQFKNLVERNKDNLFFFLLFLRITPLLPNWLINLASPIVGVPFKHFFFATFFGLMPANIMHVNMGYGLSSMKQIGFDKNILLMLLGLGSLALIPIFIKKIFANKFKSTDVDQSKDE